MKPTLYFDLARIGKYLTPIWWAVPFAIFATIAGQIVGAFILVGAFSGGSADSPETGGEPAVGFDMASLDSTAQGILLMSLFFAAALLVFLWVRLVERRTIASLGFHGLGSGLFKFARGSAFALISMAAIAFGLQAFGYAEAAPAQVPASWLLVWPLLILLAGWVVQGSTEEIVARGLLFQSVGARHGLIVGLIVSSALFSLAHGMNSNPSALFFFNLILYSLFACFYALREASLWGICGHHAIWNFAQGNLFGFAVSGEQFGADRLMQFTETGPDVVTGGATGPEGGLVTTVVLGVSMAVLLLIKPAKDLYAKVPSRPDEEPVTCPVD